jgi:hypothetical protein
VRAAPEATSLEPTISVGPKLNIVLVEPYRCGDGIISASYKVLSCPSSKSRNIIGREKRIRMSLRSGTIFKLKVPFKSLETFWHPYNLLATLYLELSRSSSSMLNFLFLSILKIEELT